MNKKIAFILALFLVFITLTGCQNINFGNGNSSNNTPKTKLTYFGYKADTINLIAMENAIQSFQKTHPNVTIKYDGIKGTKNYYEKLFLRAETGNLDDMFMLDHDNAVNLISQGLLEDLSDIVDPSKFIPVAKSQFVNEDGSIYFVPNALVTFGLYCNLDLLKLHGFEKMPTNFGELKTICDYFVKKGITPIVANNFTTVRTLVLAKGMYDVYQQEDYSETIKKFNSGEIDLAEHLRPGVEMVYQMFQDGWMDGEEAAKTKPTADDLTLFKAGDRPFMLTGAWASPRVSGEGGVNFDYTIYPYPIMSTGSVLVMDIAICMSVNANGKNKDIAKEFVSHMTDPDVIWEYCDSQSSFTPIQGDSRLPTDKALQPQIEYLSNGQTVIASNFNITFPLNEALSNLGLAIMGGCTLEEAMAVLKRELTVQNN